MPACGSFTSKTSFAVGGRPPRGNLDRSELDQQADDDFREDRLRAHRHRRPSVSSKASGEMTEADFGGSFLLSLASAGLMAGFGGLCSPLLAKRAVSAAGPQLGRFGKSLWASGI